MTIETSEIILNSGLTFLAISTSAMVIIIGVYLVKLIKDLRELSQNLNATSLILNDELKPTLKELNETMKSINSIIQNTDESVENVKANLENAITRTKSISESLMGGFFKGFMTILSLFRKK